MKFTVLFSFNSALRSNSSWFLLPASSSSTSLGLSSPHSYPPATLPARIFIISGRNISRPATEVPGCDLAIRDTVHIPDLLESCFTFETGICIWRSGVAHLYPFFPLLFPAYSTHGDWYSPAEQCSHCRGGRRLRG